MNPTTSMILGRTVKKKYTNAASDYMTISDDHYLTEAEREFDVEETERESGGNPDLE